MAEKKRRTSRSKASSGSSRKTAAGSRRRTARKNNISLLDILFSEGVIIPLSFVVVLLLFLSNLGVVGALGDFIKGVQFGLFGSLAYVFPVLIGAVLFFKFFKEFTSTVIVKLTAVIILFIDLTIMLHMGVLDTQQASGNNAFLYCRDNLTGGGILGGAVAALLTSLIGKVGAWIVIVLFIFICFWLFTGISFLDIVDELLAFIDEQSDAVYEKNVERKQKQAVREAERFKRAERRRELRAQEEELDRDIKKRRTDNKKTGVPLPSLLSAISLPNLEKEFEENDEELQDESISEEIIDEEVSEELETAYESKRAEAANNVAESEETELSEELDEEEFTDEEAFDEYDEEYSEEEYYDEEDEIEEKSEYEDPLDPKNFNVDMLCSQEFSFDSIIASRTAPEYSEETSLDVLKPVRPAENAHSETIENRNESTESISNTALNDNVDKSDERTNHEAENDNSSAAAKAAAELTDNTSGSENTGSTDSDSSSSEPSENKASEGNAETAENSVNPSSAENNSVPESEENSEKAVNNSEPEKEPETISSDNENPDSLNEANVSENSKPAMTNTTFAEKPEDIQRSSSGAVSFNKVEAKKPEDTEVKKRRELLVKEWRVPRPDAYSKLLKVPEKGEKVEYEDELRNTSANLVDALDSFGVKVKPSPDTPYIKGPTVTRYEMIPERGVKVSRILNLADDIKLTLAAADIRIEAPIPGKSAVGIEVPNSEATVVSMYELLDSNEYRNFRGKIAFAVGKGLSGNPVVTDIGKMPHALVAGATGSGKSVCINTMLMSLLFKYTPCELQLIMVDPKVVELSVYNGIPHLLVPVVTDPKQAAAALQWAVTEMDNRFNKFSDFQVRDLASFNEKIFETVGAKDMTDYYRKVKDRIESIEHLPMAQMVIIVDELADLMMSAAKDVEVSIARLAQKARACGIHLIIATQRPSVDVITGTIKANLPSRIAFAVSSGVDSKTVIDTVGAEKLLGKGDMLFLPQGYPKPERLQGAYVSDEEVVKVVDFWKQQCDAKAVDLFQRHNVESISRSVTDNDNSSAEKGDNEGERNSQQDEYLIDAAKLFIDTDKVSISMLQRKYRIGYNRAGRIVDTLCDIGVVSEEPRRVLMSHEQLDAAIESGLL